MQPQFNQSWRGQKKYYISRSNFRNRRKKTSLIFLILNKKILNVFILFIIISGLSILSVVIWLSRGLPDPNQLIERKVAQSTKIFDRTGKNILYEIYGNEQRTLVNLNQIPDYVKWATIVIEDKDFYKHQGFSFWAILRTIITNTIRGQKAGGSTLTQQFIKNAILSPEKTYTRKIKELLLAYKLEKKFSKDEILQMYLNEISYGSTAYGIEAASQRYFGKNIQNINLPEAAILAALPQAPSRYSPYGPNKDLLIQRQHYILDLMFQQGYITEPKLEAAKQFELKFQKPKTNIIAPHFVMYVKDILSEKYGEKMIEQDGLKIYTTLDLYKQTIAEEIIKEKVTKNQEQYNASNAGLVAIDPKTGQILAMVGSRDYFDEKIDGQVNITTSMRQPGSSLKPLVYAVAFTKGYTPNTIIYDTLTNFSLDPAKPYEPHNYNNMEHGPVTMAKALAGSLNIPAVKTIYLAGINNVLDLAEALGYSTLSNRDRFGLSFVLGGGEVKLIEHTNAYSVFARDGEIHPVSAILKIEDKNKNIIEEFTTQKKNVLNQQVARMINNILSDNNERAYIFGQQNWLTLGTRQVAVKTGTTNDYRDAWTIGYTPSIITGVWVGNNDNTPMKRGADGGIVAAPIWHDFMDRILGDTSQEYFKKPKQIKTNKPILDGETDIRTIVLIDKASGMLATTRTPQSFIEEKEFNEIHSLLYYVDKDDPLGKIPENPAKDPQFKLWETGVLKWAKKKGLTTSTPPLDYDNLHIPENEPLIQIIEPTDNKIIIEPILKTDLQLSAPRGIHRVEYYINDNLLLVNDHYPFNLEKQIDFLQNGYHNLKIKACDDIDNCSEKSIEFNLILDKQRETPDINILWLYPQNGIAVTDIDFPLDLKIKINNPEQIAKILFLTSQQDSNPVLLDSIQLIEQTEITGKWQNIPVSGIYNLYVEVYGWGGKIKKSEEIKVVVQKQ